MKKLVLTLAIVFAGIMSANAQVWIGGGVGARAEKGYTEFTISPELGYSINDQWQIALGANYGLATAGGVTVNELYLEPYVRYVGGTIGKKFSLFVDLTGDFELLDAGKGFAVMLRPGIAWQATDQFTAAFRLGMAGYDHGFYGTNGFLMDCALVAPEIRLYYNF